MVALVADRNCTSSICIYLKALNSCSGITQPSEWTESQPNTNLEAKVQSIACIRICIVF